MIKYKGTTLYPAALVDLLNAIEEVRDYIIEVRSNEVGLDDLMLHLCLHSENAVSDRKIKANLQARLRVTPAVRYVTMEEIRVLEQTPEGRKTTKFLDRRDHG